MKKNNKENNKETLCTDQINKARLFFEQPALFLKGVVDIEGLPANDLTEVAFAGRSNVGKSTLLNALTRQNHLARTSNTPGRTREINFFTLSDSLYLVDLPGYGYAVASKSLIRGWTKLMHDYFRGRTQLRRVFILIDSRHGAKESDKKLMVFLNEVAQPYQIILTKIDKCPTAEIEKIVTKIFDETKKYPACHPDILKVSAIKKYGLDEIRKQITNLVAQ